ncbi:2-keto-4-pentenoate hydratase [Caulobacter sp. KR2-114]|uniref:2-keto-4-pentenoate hydratase n=1 Tax=Caulobacter sp. KR2-114 TaxID=3400912 RepID=UPI003C0D6ED4
MTSLAAPAATYAEAKDVARRLVEARLAARPLAGIPGPLPDTLDQAYQIQDAAIALWPDEIAGWKVGRVPAAPGEEASSERLAGPIFRRQVRQATPGETPFPVLVGGFAAVEAEFVIRLGADAPAGKVDWSLDEAAALVAAWHIGVETAGSPMAEINAIGGVAVAGDFGNNAGVILGPEVPGWRERPLDSMACEVTIDGRRIGTGTAASIPGGPLESLVFLLGHCAGRGLPLRAGALVATGAATGVHDIVSGQSSVVSFGALGAIACRAEPARPFALGTLAP